MPEIKFKHLVSCSSEDKVYKAENLLKPELYRKWKCATPGEKRASVILQFEKATEIHSIDIGNEGSAFVEILAGKSSDAANDYQVLLVASSFMSPLESRNETKTNRVRMFGPDKLSQNLKGEKWDCVQIVCTQPFNKNIQYGLSFIKFHSPPDPSQQSTNEPESKESSLKFGAFKMKDDDENNKLSVGSWFQKRNNSADSPPLSGAAAIRQASSFAAAALASADTSTSAVIRKATTQVPVVKRKYSPDVTDTSPNNQKKFTTVRVDKDKIQLKKMNEGTPNKDKDKPTSSKTIDHDKKSSENVKSLKVKPFNRLMEKVVFVLSGFQNPFRSELRDKALEMGAKYKGDWDNSCTHLVCAFLNTPKYNQVLQQKGRIVTKEWIIDCHKKRKLLPWRKYMLGKYSKDTTTEEEESDEEQIQIPVRKEAKNDNKVKLNSSAATKAPEELKETEPGSSRANGKLERSVTEGTVLDSEAEDYEADTDADSSSSGGDTEDEIRKVEEQQAKQANSSGDQSDKSEARKRKKKRAVFEEKESDDEYDNQCDSLVKTDTKDLPLPELPDFLKGKHFFLYGDFSYEERHKLRRYIIGFSGSIEQYMGDNVNFVITDKKWDKNFDEALSENDNLIFVRPQWVLKCGQDCRFVPYQPYIVIPNT